MAEIKKVAVIGAGIMGNGIAQVSAQAGFEVVMSDIEQKYVERGLDSIKKSLARIFCAAGISKPRILTSPIDTVVI